MVILSADSSADHGELEDGLVTFTLGQDVRFYLKDYLLGMFALNEEIFYGENIKLQLPMRKLVLLVC